MSERYDIDSIPVKKVGVLLSVVFLAAFLLFSGSGAEQDLSSAIESEGLKASDISGYELKDYRQEKVAGIDTVDIVASKGSSRFELMLYSGVSPEFARNLVKDRRNEISAIYTDKPAPYEGIPERAIECKETYVVNVTESQDGLKSNYSLYAGNDYAMGACSEEEAAYRVEMFMEYCESSSVLYEAAVFVPVNSDQDGHPEVGC